MIVIDGSQGEGGGQIIRSSLALSMVTGKPVRIINVRAGRRKPGLRRQHLTAMQASRKICSAEVLGAEIGSNRLEFHPGNVRPGDYAIRIGTAGSTTLVLQTVLPALMIAEARSHISLEGGTHNPFAPPFDFLAAAYLPLLERIGPRVVAQNCRPGFYPVGGGGFDVTVWPDRELKPLRLLTRGNLVRREVRALVANLPLHIARRECRTIASATNWDESCFVVRDVKPAPGPGNVVMIELRFENVTEVFTGFGQRGKKAEAVASDVLTGATQYLDSGLPVGPHLADQLMLPLGISAYLGRGGGSFMTGPLSGHSTTHLSILEQFLDVKTKVTQNDGGSVMVQIG